MRTASVGLTAILNSGATQFLEADMFSFTFTDGTVLRYTDKDRDLKLSGNTFSSMGPRISRTKWKLSIGVSVDEMDITILAKSTDLVRGYPLLQAIVYGLFDGAMITVERIIRQGSWNDDGNGALKVFVGRVGEAQVERGQAKIKVVSMTDLLTIKMPKFLYQPDCLHSLFDSGCDPTGSLLTTWGHTTASVSAGSNTSTILLNGFTTSPDVWTRGRVIGVTGSNAGISRTVELHQQITSGAQVTMTCPFPFAFTVGDTVNLYAGCKKSKLECTNKFNNILNFRGFPYVPVPETVLGYYDG